MPGQLRSRRGNPRRGDADRHTARSRAVRSRGDAPLLLQASRQRSPRVRVRALPEGRARRSDRGHQGTALPSRGGPKRAVAKRAGPFAARALRRGALRIPGRPDHEGGGRRAVLPSGPRDPGLDGSRRDAPRARFGAAAVDGRARDAASQGELIRREGPVPERRRAHVLASAGPHSRRARSPACSSVSVNCASAIA